jgi:hypothetical protein
VAVARRQLAPGVANADDGAAIEHVVRITLVLDPAPMQETIFSFTAEPLLTTSRTLCFHARQRTERADTRKITFY